MRKDFVLSSRDVIVKFLDNDLERFLKRYYRYHKWEMIFSITLPNYDRKVPGIKKEILDNYRNTYPNQIVDIINTHRVMVQYYDFVIDLEDIQLSEHIVNVLGTKIDEYINRRNARRWKDGKTPSFLTQIKAKRELKARGFVTINDFEDFDRKFAHITTNANFKFKAGKRLYFPFNFAWDDKTYRTHMLQQKFSTNIYGAMGTGVRGFTRISTPLDRR